MLLSKNLRFLRTSNNLKQKDFEEIGLKRASYGHYETGKSDPPLPVLVKIANYFSVKIDDLLFIDMERRAQNPGENPQLEPANTESGTDILLLKKEIELLEEKLKNRDLQIQIVEDRLGKYIVTKKEVG
jgi:transcriptional regulator with XRE-family HTH domain